MATKRFKALLESVDNPITTVPDASDSMDHPGIHTITDPRVLQRVNKMLRALVTNDRRGDQKQMVTFLRLKLNFVGVDFDPRPLYDTVLPDGEEVYFPITSFGGRWGKTVDTAFDQFDSSDGIEEVTGHGLQLVLVPDGNGNFLDAFIEAVEPEDGGDDDNIEDELDDIEENIDESTTGGKQAQKRHDEDEKHRQQQIEKNREAARERNRNAVAKYRASTRGDKWGVKEAKKPEKGSWTATAIVNNKVKGSVPIEKSETSDAVKYFHSIYPDAVVSIETPGGTVHSVHKPKKNNIKESPTVNASTGAIAGLDGEPPVSKKAQKKHKQKNQIDELSKKTLSSYAKKATDNAVILSRAAATASSNPKFKDIDGTYDRTIYKRTDGIKKAVNKLAQEQKSFGDFMSSLEEKKRCWKGYKPTPGKKPYEKGSCQKAEESISEWTANRVGKTMKTVDGEGIVTKEEQRYGVSTNGIVQVRLKNGKTGWYYYDGDRVSAKIQKEKDQKIQKESSHEEYYYIKGQHGMRSNGSFTKDESKWITFDKDYKEKVEKNNGRPYGATYQGAFISTTKFKK